MADDRQKTLADLVARTAGGDRRAFDTLYETTSARLHALCLSILGDRRPAEEALERIYVRIWTEARHFSESGLTPAAWLATLARAEAMERKGRDAEGSAATDIPDPEEGPDPVGVLRAAWVQGLGYSRLAARVGLSQSEVRHVLHEGLERVSGHAAEDADSLAAAEQALGLRPADATATVRPDLAFWQERLARFADELTPVMAPARARQRIRETLGHGMAPLSVDPTEKRPWWRGPLGIALALLAAAAGWYLATR